MTVVCEVCDRPDSQTVVRGLPMHVKCAPAGWVESDRVHTEFMGKVRVLAETRWRAWARWKP